MQCSPPFLAIFCASVSAASALIGQTPTEPPVRLFAEAEDFRIASGDWHVVPFGENYFACTFAVSFLSRMACLGAPPQTGDERAVAVQDVEIPYASDYTVLARYEQPYNFAVEFTVEVEQNGKTVYRNMYGRLKDPKIWAFNGHKRVPMERYSWGGTDNIVWQHFEPAKLAAGTATIRLIADRQTDAGKPRINPGKRHVDVICLTNDQAGMEVQQKKARYLEMDGWLVQDGDLFARLTVAKSADNPVAPVLAPHKTGQHSPYYVHVRDWPSIRVLRTGYAPNPTAYRIDGPRSRAVKPTKLAPLLDSTLFEKPPGDLYLKPGERSDWIPLGGLIDALNNSNWILDFTGRIEFGIPGRFGGIKAIRELDVAGRTEFELPGCVAPNRELRRLLAAKGRAPVVRTPVEALNWLCGVVRDFPDVGGTPERFLIYNIMGFGRGLDLPEGQEFARLLGDNTMVDQQGKKRGMRCHWRNPDVKWIQQQEQKESFDSIRIVSYGDEIHLPPSAPEGDEFATWLKARGVDFDGPLTFTKERDNPLYYYSKLFAMEKGAAKFATGTAYYASKGILTGANYSPHANYLVTDMQYVRPFKLKAMSMPWSEDYIWTVPQFSLQVMGYLTSAFRAGAKYHDMPIHMYVMPHSPGNTPEEFRLSFYTAVGHGATMINYFCASPQAVGNTENYVATDDVPMWRAIYDCTHEADIFEDYVMDGKVRPARVGLLLSSVDEILGDANNFRFELHNNERKAIYYALRHSQVPVDFVTEDDVIEGLADDMDVIYVMQEWLHSKAVRALTGWCRKGGTLVAMCGGGFRNELNRANAEARALFGVKEQEILRDENQPDYIREEKSPFLSKQDLPLCRPFDTVTFTSGTDTVSGVETLIWKQRIEPTDAEVVGTFSDGSPAVIRKTHGKGKVVLFGFLPGQAYLKGALPVRPPDRTPAPDSFGHFLPTDMNPALRRALVDAFLPADFARPVVCDTPLVETTCIDTQTPQKRLAISLLNYSGSPVADLAVRITGLADAANVRSVKYTDLSVHSEGVDTVVRLPLEVADMLLIDLPQ